MVKLPRLYDTGQYSLKIYFEENFGNTPWVLHSQWKRTWSKGVTDTSAKHIEMPSVIDVIASQYGTGEGLLCSNKVLRPASKENNNPMRDY